jgi:hypothetical protein
VDGTSSIVDIVTVLTPGAEVGGGSPLLSGGFLLFGGFTIILVYPLLGLSSLIVVTLPLLNNMQRSYKERYQNEELIKLFKNKIILNTSTVPLGVPICLP